MFILLGLFLIAVVYLVINLSKGNTSFFGRAASRGVFSSAGSYVFASSLSAAPGGEKIRVTAFVLDGEGRGISDKSVSLGCRDEGLCQNAKINFTPLQPVSDGFGQVIFEVSSPIAGKFEVEARTEEAPIAQTVTLVFQ